VAVITASGVSDHTHPPLFPGGKGGHGGKGGWQRGEKVSTVHDEEDETPDAVQNKHPTKNGGSRSTQAKAIFGRLSLDNSGMLGVKSILS
jgi:hypothetical protein